MKPVPWGSKDLPNEELLRRIQQGGDGELAGAQIQYLDMVRFRDEHNREWYVDAGSFKHYVEEGRIAADAALEILPQTMLKVTRANPSRVQFPLSELKRSTPPAFGERALLLLLAKEDRDHIIGDLAEEYTEISSSHGERFAKVWYWKQVIASLPPMIFKFIRRCLYAYIEEWFRRHI